MTQGVTATLAELIALKRYAFSVQKGVQRCQQVGGQRPSKLRARGMDFAEVRHYQAGDELRHMEWRVTARTGKPHIKLYEEERERPFIVLADFSPSMYFGTKVAFKSVVAARLLALLTWIALKQGDKVGGLLFSAEKHQEFTPQRHEKKVLPFLAATCAYTEDFPWKNKDAPKVTQSLSHALMRLRRVIKPGSKVALISDFYHLDKDCEQHLSQLRLHHHIEVYAICDILELAPPPRALYGVTDGHQQLLLDTTHATVNSSYQNYCNERQFSLKTMLEKLQISHQQITATTNLMRLAYQ